MKTQLKLMARDDALIEFLKRGFIADTQLLNALFFNNKNSCHRRLRQLYQYNLIKRTRNDSREPFVYYHTRFPDDVQHTLLKAQLFAQFKHHQLEVLDYRLNVPLINCVADLALVVRHQGVTHLILADVSTRRPFNDEKYIRMGQSNPELFQAKLKTFPSFERLCILACCPKVSSLTIARAFHLCNTRVAQDFPDFIQFLETP